MPALLLLGYALYSWLYLDTVRGWTSLMVVVLLLGSAQMLLIGVIGEYLGRLYMESKHRPLYFVKETINSDCEQSTDSIQSCHVRAQSVLGD